jgi:hypothetical protein
MTQLPSPDDPGNYPRPPERATVRCQVTGLDKSDLQEGELYLMRLVKTETALDTGDVTVTLAVVPPVPDPVGRAVGRLRREIGMARELGESDALAAAASLTTAELLAQVIARLGDIDDALRNTVGGVPRLR